MVQDPKWQEDNKDGITLGHLNTLIESGMDFANIPFPEKVCPKCGKYYKMDTIITSEQHCSNCSNATFQNSTEQINAN